MLLLLAIVIGLRLLYGLKPHKQKNTKKQKHKASKFDFQLAVASVFAAASCSQLFVITFDVQQ